MEHIVRQKITGLKAFINLGGHTEQHAGVIPRVQCLTFL